MSASPNEGLTYRFSGWELLPSRRRLVVGGETVDIGSRAMDVLVALTERQARIVSKDELLTVAWPGRVVEENNISVQIASLRKLLGRDVITTVPGVGYRLTAQAEAAVADAPGTAAAAGAPRLFGREDDLASLLAMVGRRPLVSITGPGGVGKTALARHLLSGRHGARWPQIHWVDLTLLRPGDSVPAAVAAEVGVLGTAGDTTVDLLAALSRTHALIALDNCEHMASDTARFVAEALDAAPGLRWLVTSQVPLHVGGEHVHQLRPLCVPTRETAYSDAVRQGAVALLRARAAAAYRPLEITPANIELAIDICRELDGLPLAIEMAASRIAALGLETVRDQLNHRLRLSSRERAGPDRQQTLSSTYDWSYGLLTDAEQRAFRRMEPFIGGFTARMARAMACADDDADDGPAAWEALEALSVLVERSLVHRVPGGRNRYSLFESARDYARARLDEAGETQAVQRRHAEVMAHHFSTARVDHERHRDADWAARYIEERHNVRAALAWACSHDDPDLLASHVAALAQIDTFSRNPAEIVHCNVPIDTLLRATPSQRAAACAEFSWAHFLDGDRKLGSELASQAWKDFSTLGDTAGAYQALAQLIRLYESRPGTMAQAQEAAAALAAIDGETIPLRLRLFREITAGLQYSGARTVARLHELHELAMRAGFDTLAAVCRVNITDQQLIDGRFDDVVDTARRFESSRESRPRVRATVLVNLVLALVQLGRADEASEPAKIVFRTLPGFTYHVIAAFALAAVRQRRYDEAAMMIGYCSRVRQERNQRADPAEKAAEAEVDRTLVAHLPAPKLAALRRMGGDLSLSEVWSFIP